MLPPPQHLLFESALGLSSCGLRDGPRERETDTWRHPCETERGAVRIARTSTRPMAACLRDCVKGGPHARTPPAPERGDPFYHIPAPPFAFSPCWVHGTAYSACVPAC